MKRYLYIMMGAAVIVAIGGCFNLEVKEPLVDLDDGSSGSANSSYDTTDSATADGDTSKEQSLRKKLMQCEYELAEEKKKCDKLEDKREEDKKHYERKIDELEGKLDDLKDENKKLRKKIEKLCDN